MRNFRTLRNSVNLIQEVIQIANSGHIFVDDSGI